MINDRYSRNMTTLSQEENDSLRSKKVCVVGCGGLGGYILEMLARLGVGTLTAVDGDSFDASNLNRQLLATETVLGLSKTTIAVERIKLINSDVKVNPVQSLLVEDNASQICRDHHVLVDALDNVHSRMLLQKTASNLKIPMVHGAIAGWYGQVTTILPGDDTLSKLYGDNEDRGIETELGNPSFTPALVASLQVAEVVKLLIGRGELLRGRIFYIDTLQQEVHYL